MFISRLLPLKHARRMGSDTSGVAAVEFALIAPLCLVMLLGAIEYSRAVLMARRFQLITAMASDLIAREDAMDDTKIQGIEAAVRTVWAPYDAGTLNLKVIAVRAAADTAPRMAPGNRYVYWSKALIPPSGTPPYAPGSNYADTSLAGMLSNGASTILVNSTYTFQTLFGTRAPGMTGATMAWTASSSHAPRNLCVGYPTANCSTSYE